MDDLASKTCQPCKGGEPPLSEGKVRELAKQLAGDWYAEENHHLEKEYKFKNFREALDFTNAIGMIAEREGHHPDIQLSWGKVVVTLYTHKIDGLSLNDFILAAKFDQAYTFMKRAA